MSTRESPPKSKKLVVVDIWDDVFESWYKMLEAVPSVESIVPFVIDGTCFDFELV